MFLSKHPVTKKYYVYYFTPEGKRKSRSTKTTHKAKALKFLSRLQKQLDEERDREFIPISLKDFYFNYLRNSEPHFTDKTIKAHKTTKNYLLDYFGNVQLSEITTPKIEEYISDRLRSSIYAARRDFSNLSAALNKAVRSGYLVNNPCTGIKRLRLPEKQPLFYSREDFQKLIEAIDDKDIRDLVIMAVNTGLRQGELISMQWDQINFNDKIVILTNHNHITKSKKIRTIPLNDHALNVLLNRLSSKSEKHNYVFTYLSEAIEQVFFSKFFKRYIISAKLNPKLNFHSLRHTFASYLVQKGVSIYTVSKLLGHADIKTTQIYSHLRSEDLRNAVDIL